MHIESFRNYCLALKGTEECFPFDEHTLVFKVMGKMYALSSLKWEHFSINLKCDPEKAILLREQYASIEPGYHMSKKHWNTINVDQQELSDSQIKELIDHSYELVVSSLTKKLQAELNAL